MACLAQTMEVFWQQGGAAAACDVARARRGTWFDPTLVDAVDELERDVASGPRSRRPTCRPSSPPTASQRADDARLDRVAEAFAGIVDAKSPYTARHCAGVAEIADGIAATMGLDDADPAASCAAPRSCTTSASSASPTASSTSPAR